MTPPTDGATTPHRPWRSRVELIVTVLVLGLIAGALVVFLGKGDEPDKPTKRPESAPSELATAGPPAGVPPTPEPSVVTPSAGGPVGGLQTVAATYPVRVSTANIYTKMSAGAARADLDALTQPGTDLIGLNEITPGRAGQISSWVSSRPGWNFYAPPASPTPYRVSNSLLWNSRNLELLETGSEYGSPSRTTYKVDSRWITWGKFLHKPTQTHVYFLVTHTDPAVERRGVPRNVPAVGANLTYMRALLSLSEKMAEDGVVIICGDWNVNARADRSVKAASMPYAVLEGLGAGPVISSYTALGFTFPPTSPQSGRWIDYVAIWDRAAPGAPNLVFDKHYASTGAKSDHLPVTVDFGLKTIKLMGLDQLKELQDQAQGKGR